MNSAVAMSNQPDLLQAGPGVVFEDDTGRVDYRPALLTREHAESALQALSTGVAWRTEERSMYGRRVAVPRLLAAFRLDAPQLPSTIARIAEAVKNAVDAPFDTVGLNLYRDQHDSVAPHNDHLYEIAEGEPIALVSLGATRTMVISSKHGPRRSIRLDLDSGSLLTMSWATQQHYDHGIPKQRAPVGPRISLAFRVRPRA